MKSIIEIAKIVTQKKVKKIEIFDDAILRQRNNKFFEFYQGVTLQRFKTDRDAAQQLYKCDPQDAKYRQLKSRFKKRLLNTLFFLDINKPAVSSYERAYFSCNKDWTLVKILLANNALESAASQAKGILTVALRFQFADVIVNCSRILRDYYATHADEKEYEVYDTYIKQYAEILQAEIRSEELYQRVIIEYYMPLSKTVDLLERIDTYCHALVGLSETYQSPIVYFNMFMVWTMRYEMLRDYHAMLEVCAQAEQYVTQNPDYYQEEKQIIFYTKKMTAFLHLRDFRQGRINAEKCLNTFPEGSKPWFTFMEYYLLLTMHTENYYQASAILAKTMSHSEFKRLDLTNKEKWSVFEVYVQFMIDLMGQKQPLMRKNKKRNARLTELLEHPDSFSKEHRILGVHLWILKILMLLEQRQFSTLNEQIELLKPFGAKLNKQEFYRPLQFIKLLQQLRKANYNPREISNTDKYYNRLINQPFSYRGALSELEIIPFEKLWEIVIQNL